MREDGFIIAFKILDEAELSLLDDTQRGQYENELGIYRQRVAFVEQLEKQENVTIRVYEPKLSPVTILGKMEVRSFTKPAYDITFCNSVTKPNLWVYTANSLELETPVLSAPPKLPAIVVDHIKSIERARPELPVVGKAAAPTKRFGVVKRKRPDLPIVEKAINELSVSAISFKEVNPVHADLPDLFHKHLVNTSFNKPKTHKAVLPTVTKPTGSIPKIGKIKSVDPQLPIVTVPSVHLNQFVSLKQPSVLLPVMFKPNVLTRAFKPLNNTVSRLPDVVTPSTGVKPFVKTESETVALPEKTVVVIPDVYEKLKDFFSVVVNEPVVVE